MLTMVSNGRQMSRSEDGGVIIIDLPKTFTEEEATQQLRSLYIQRRDITDRMGPLIALQMKLTIIDDDIRSLEGIGITLTPSLPDPNEETIEK